ncbi:MAG: hypothetical protein AAF909_12335, partial [Pseudomonadota bacterium]
PAPAPGLSIGGSAPMDDAEKPEAAARRKSSDPASGFADALGDLADTFSPNTSPEGPKPEPEPDFLDEEASKQVIDDLKLALGPQAAERVFTWPDQNFLPKAEAKRMRQAGESLRGAIDRGATGEALEAARPIVNSLSNALGPQHFQLQPDPARIADLDPVRAYADTLKADKPGAAGAGKGAAKGAAKGATAEPPEHAARVARLRRGQQPPEPRDRPEVRRRAADRAAAARPRPAPELSGRFADRPELASHYAALPPGRRVSLQQNVHALEQHLLQRGHAPRDARRQAIAAARAALQSDLDTHRQTTPPVFLARNDDGEPAVVEPPHREVIPFFGRNQHGGEQVRPIRYMDLGPMIAYEADKKLRQGRYPTVHRPENLIEALGSARSGATYEARFRRLNPLRAIIAHRARMAADIASGARTRPLEPLSISLGSYIGDPVERASLEAWVRRTYPDRWDRMRDDAFALLTDQDYVSYLAETSIQANLALGALNGLIEEQGARLSGAGDAAQDWAFGIVGALGAVQQSTRAAILEDVPITHLSGMLAYASARAEAAATGAKYGRGYGRGPAARRGDVGARGGADRPGRRAFWPLPGGG